VSIDQSSSSRRGASINAARVLGGLKGGRSPYNSYAMDKVYHLIENYGYLIVFLGVVLGTMGILFPSAAILLAAGVLV